MVTKISSIYTWLVYVILWGMVWTYPVLAEAMGAMQDDATFSHREILHSWMLIAPFFVLFLVHRIPVYRLLLHHRVKAYCLSAVMLLLLFGVCRYHTVMPGDPPRHSHSQELRTPPAAPPPARRPFGPNEPVTADDAPLLKGHTPKHHTPPKHRPTFIGIPGIVTLDLIIAILMMGFDIAIVLLSRYQEEEKKKYRLEAAHKERELEHLKAQINPHFFMNMLNNIHVMVELDPPEAQKMIMKLSRMMRYVLYEGARPLTSLQKEKEFISNYVELMRKRCSSKHVHISLHMPDDSHDRMMLPPLLFISVIENAFKHGISYRDSSFVEIRLDAGDREMRLECLNSVHPDSAPAGRGEGGIGLANLSQRLHLLYGDNFNLDIHHTSSIYHVNLTIPCQYETDQMSCSR